MRKVKSVTLLGRTWFDKVNGNTYHSAKVFVGGVLVAVAPFQYGYGDAWQWSAAQALHDAGLFTGPKCLDGANKPVYVACRAFKRGSGSGLRGS